MRKRTYSTSVNFLIESQLCQRLRYVARGQKVPMSVLIRAGVKLILEKIDEENKAKKNQNKNESPENKQDPEHEQNPK